MDTIEILVYFGVALTVGTLIYFFTSNADFGQFYDNARGKEEQVFQKVSADDFIQQSVTFWQGCGMGEVPRNLTLYIEGTGQLDKTAFFSIVKKLNYCQTLQSLNEGCGTKEDLDMQVIDLPRVVRLECDPAAQRLIIR